MIAAAALRALVFLANGNKSETVGAHSRVAAHEGGRLYLTDDVLGWPRLTAAAPRGAISVRT